MTSFIDAEGKVGSLIEISKRQCQQMDRILELLEKVK